MMLCYYDISDNARAKRKQINYKLKSIKCERKSYRTTGRIKTNTQNNFSAFNMT